MTKDIIENMPRLVGAHVAEAGVSYRVWAPDHQAVSVRIQRAGAAERIVSLTRDHDGFFEGVDSEGRAGDLYHFDLGQAGRFPDPASRFQPRGVHAVSEVIDPSAYEWRTTDWDRPAWKGQPIYELHVGAFTEDGTFLSAIDRLDHIVELGVSAIEIMPIADFAGDRNWGYDGVSLFAPARCYGRPDDLRALVDAAHQRGLAVILDVVYNHLGPAGNYLSQFAKEYFHQSRDTPWGTAINFDGANSRPVRDHFLGNVLYWLEDYKIDGLRLDATHAIEDTSKPHLLAEISELVHAHGGFVIAEDERNSSQVLLPRDAEGLGLDAVWSDDFHHQVRVALTGVNEGYFASYSGAADALALTLSQGWFYTGQGFPYWQGKPRGTPASNLPPKAFVYCIENHDQVGNRAIGERLEHLVSAELFRAASMLLCLSPYPPLIFMGQEWAAETPFLYFTNHQGDLGKAISEGRRKEFAQAGWNLDVLKNQIPDPEELMTFVRSKLAWNELERAEHRATFALYREALQARRIYVDGAVTERENWSVTVAGPAVVVRYQRPDERTAVLIVAFTIGSIPSRDAYPMLQNRAGKRWRVELQSESPKFGGTGSLRGSLMSTDEMGSPWLDFAVPGAVLLVEDEA
ncbi:MAG TPA: malto-oligosyltrehalose trehalohydrolase [Opitutaceae bacterium]|nr:malto-oligosyltrehalose trehalohydrolase [Opitutaceae bacterium]